MIEKKLKDHLGADYCPPEICSPPKRGRQRATNNVTDSSDQQTTITQMLAVRKRLNGSATKSPTVSSPIRKVSRLVVPRNRAYIPAQGSSGFAILVALLRYELEFNQKLVNKLDLQEMAQRYSMTTIGQTSAQRYPGWQTVKTLLAKDLVAKTDARNSYFFLTDEGRKLARNLAKASPVLRGKCDCELCFLYHNSNFDFLLDFARQFLTNQPDPIDVDNDLNSSSDDEEEDSSPSTQQQTESSNTTEALPTFRPFIFEPGQYEIILCIDTRERIATNFCSDKNAAFASALQKQDVRVEIRQLPLGDFVWIAREKSRS